MYFLSNNDINLCPKRKIHIYTRSKLDETEFTALFSLVFIARVTYYTASERSSYLTDQYLCLAVINNYRCAFIVC